MTENDPSPPTQQGAPVGALVDHLFRRESGKMVAALTRVFGTHHLALAEDVVQETLLQALRHWPFMGVPRNPAGWLYQVARNRATDLVRREQVFRRIAPEITALAAPGGEDALDGVLGEHAVDDDTLRMMFTCCHPALPLESQVALTLKILGGFSAAEVARGLLTEEAAMEKRLYRARQRLRETRIPYEVPTGRELAPRTQAVLTVLYLMFNEGYSASFFEHPIRRDMCLEAMRLGTLVVERVPAAHPEACALMALMCLHAARFDARLDGDGNLLTLSDQDRARWDGTLIAQGLQYLERSGSGDLATALHLEAGIAALHCVAESYPRTDWVRMLHLYDLLLRLNPTPIVCLNRAIALAEVHGPAAALDALRPLQERREVRHYHLLPAALGEMHLRLGDVARAQQHFDRAFALTASVAERRFLERKLLTCRALVTPSVP